VIDNGDVNMGTNHYCETDTGIKPKPHNYYIVSFNTAGTSTTTGSSKTAKYYVGQLLDKGTDPSANEFNFKFMRYSRKVADHFVWPNYADEAVVSLEDVTLELSPPKCARRGRLIFLAQQTSPYMKWIH
jgi:hypothetical protein